MPYDFQLRSNVREAMPFENAHERGHRSLRMSRQRRACSLFARLHNAIGALHDCGRVTLERIEHDPSGDHDRYMMEGRAADAVLEGRWLGEHITADVERDVDHRCFERTLAALHERVAGKGGRARSVTAGNIVAGPLELLDGGA